MKKLLLSLVVMVLSVLTAHAAWEKTTSIAVGDVVVLAYDDGNVAKELSGFSTGSTVFGTVEDYTTMPSGLVPLTVVTGSEEGTFAFQVDETTFLSWSSGNTLTTSEDVTGASSWTVSINEDGKADIYNAGTPARKLQYNSGSPRFACYTSTQKAPYLWKQLSDDALTAPIIAPASGTVFETQSVTITADEGATIYYTLDGSEPTTESSLYSEVLSISETTTVKAIAVKDGQTSSVATATFTFGPVYSTFAAANTAATSTHVVSRLTFTEALVTFVNGQNAYIQDASGAMMLYGNAASTLNAGDKISGYVQGELYLYNGLPEVANFTLSAETVSTGNEVAPATVDAAALAANPLAFVSQYVQVSPATFAESQEVSTKTNVNFTVGETALILRNNFTVQFSVDAEKQYTVAGIVTIYNDNVQLYPLAATDIAEIQSDPTTAIVNAGFNPEADPIGWSKVSSAQFNDAGMGLIGTYTVRGEHSAATIDDTHLATEYAAGLECRWNGNFASFTQTTAELPAGSYKLTYDVENTNATTTAAAYENRFNVTVGETTYKDESTEWMNGKSAWTTHEIAFTLAEASPITISLGYGTGSNNLGVGNTPNLFVSHLKLASISALEIALINLKTAIDAAQAQTATYTVGEDLFTYPASQITPLTEAIATAQAAYEAAESAEAVQAALATLNEFIASFAPTMQTPDAEKQYTLKLKDGGMYMSINEGIKLSADEFPFSFEAVEGGYALKNGTNYVAFTGTGNNTWTMSATAEPYAWSFSSLGEGYYTIAKATNAAELIGVDNTEAGSPCYANKGAGDKATWTIAEYVAPEVFTITVGATQNGTVEVSATEAAEGDVITLTVTPAEGYVLKNLTVNGAGQTIAVSEENTFVMPAGNVTITAAFFPTPVIADGTYYLKNVSTGTYLAGGSNWGTHAITSEFGLDYIFAQTAEGKYTLDSQVSNGGNNNYLNGEWNDGSAMGWILTKVDGTEDVYTLGNGESYLTASTENNNVSLAADATVATAQWQFISKADFFTALEAEMANATEENGVDATALIAGANFNRNDLRNNTWKFTNSGGNYTIAGPNENRATYGCEFWNNTFDFYQTIENVPNGYYKFSVDGFGSDGTTYVYANEVETPFVNTDRPANFRAALEQIAAGELTGNITDMVTVIDGKLTIGVKRTENKASDWAVFDNARLTYYGEVPIAKYQEALANTVTAAEAVERTVPAAAYQTLAAVVAEHNKEYETAEEYTAAVTAIKEAMDAVKPLQPIYAKYDVVNKAAESLKAQDFYKQPAAATGAFDAVLSAQSEAVEAITSAEELATAVDAAIAAIRPAALEFVSHVEMNEGAAFDITHFAITNPTPTTSVDGWTVAGATPKLESNCGEFWNASGASIKQTLANMPAGSYTLSALALTRTDMVATLSAGEQSVNIVTVGNDVVNNLGQADAWFNADNGTNEVAFQLAEDGDVEIGLTADASETGDHWMVWRSFALTYAGNGYIEPIEVPVIADGTYYMYNKEAEGYLVGANSWGTQASVAPVGGIAVELTKLEDGKYTISTASCYPDKFLGSNAYVDGSSFGWTIAAVEGQEGVFTVAKDAEYLVTTEGTTALSFSAELTDGAYWQFQTKESLEALFADASEAEPADATFYIQNPNFSRNASHSQWTETHTGGDFQWGNGDNANFNAQMWNGNFNAQTIVTDVPNGKYRMYIQGFYRDGSSDNVATNYRDVVLRAKYSLNGVEKSFMSIAEEGQNPNVTGNQYGSFTFPNNQTQASACFTAGLYDNQPVVANVTNHTLTIKIYNDASVSNDWTVWDNIRLQYIGAVDVSAYAQGLADAVAAAQALEGTIPTDAYTALNAVVSEQNKEYETPEEYEAAIAAIQEATNTAKAMQSIYAEYPIVKQKVQNLTAQEVYTDAEGTAATALTTAIETQDAAIEKATDVASIQAAIDAVRAAGFTFVNSVELTGVFDLTELAIANPTPTSNANGWTVSQAPVFDAANNNAEFWNASGASIRQTVAGLPAGYYTLTAVALTRTDMVATLSANTESVNIATVGSDVVNNRTQAATWFNNGNGVNNLEFQLEEAGDVEIALTADNTTGDHWMVWRSFKLTFAGNDPLAGIRALYNEAMAAIDDAFNDDANQNIVGSEAYTLMATMPEEEPTTREEYQAAIDAMNEALAAFKAAAPAYNQLAAAIENAVLVGAADYDEAWAAIADDVEYTAANAAADAITYKMAAADYVTEHFSETATVAWGEWTDENIGDNKGQHYDGTAESTYTEQKEGWGQNAWSASRTQTITMPAGVYMLKVAVRNSDASTAYSSVTVGEEETQVFFPAAGGVGLGIDVNGNTNFSVDASYANNNAGFGWQWLFVPFTLEEEADVTITFAGEANTQHQWMSFTDWQILLDPVATGINGVRNNGERFQNANVFDLSGRKVVKPAKGLYIVNGKKVVVK